MVRRRVQRVEVVIGGFHFRPFGDLEAHAGEDLDHPVAGLRDGMQMADALFLRGERDVQFLRAHAQFHSFGLQRLPAFAQHVLDILADAVGERADDRPLLRRQSAHAAQDGGQFAFFTQEMDAGLFQRLFAVRLGDERVCAFLDFFQLFSHCLVASGSLQIVFQLLAAAGVFQFT